MKSPFPGMDPYLERRWGDVHTRLCSSISAALQSKLPPDLRARAQEDVILESADEGSTYFEPDVVIVEGDEKFTPETSTAAIAVLSPLIVSLPRPKRQRWIEILDTADGNRVVTAIEILSPGNKSSGRLNRDYVQKLQKYPDANVSVVEIDLLRSSRDRLTVPADLISKNHRADYYTCICRAKKSSQWLVYPMPLRSPLREIPIPCRETDADVPLKLQPIIDRLYIDGGHDDLKYDRQLEPPLSVDDAKWFDELLSIRATQQLS